MNRETKRAMARQQRTTDQGERLQQLRKQQAARRTQTVRSAAPGRTQRRGGLRGIGRFGGEVMAEMRKVNWPDRKTVFGYTVVVLVAVTAITLIIFGLDFLFGKAVFTLYT
ncbi:MAG TPA: preprotein translocase subunit SecE [Actinomycetes bacterium]|nr:preprotein translocase subunit SecE [Actinomycetes bacterium]